MSYILKFENVSFAFHENKPILDSVSFSVKKDSKIALMGQNGSGKTTLFRIITRAISPDNGKMLIDPRVSVGISKQAIEPEDLMLTVQGFLRNSLEKNRWEGEVVFREILDVVHLQVPMNKLVRELSGGQRARLLVAGALVKKPDILLLDEPTNNLDAEGTLRLGSFLQNYKKTCLVISHDADFLSSFVQGTLYLDSRTHVVEYYKGTYLDTVKSLTIRIEKENKKNAQLQKNIRDKQEKANFFAHKGGSMRKVAKKLKKQVEELREEIVDVRKDDTPIKDFVFPNQKDVRGNLICLTSMSVFRNKKVVTRPVDVPLRAGDRLLVSGPNGIGKTSFLNTIFNGGNSVHAKNLKIGYYKQDFSVLKLEETVFEMLFRVMDEHNEPKLRSVAANFQITASFLHKRIYQLSEGQKGLVMLACLVLQEPGVLLLDEPTNHINFRHLPVLANALNEYGGALVLVSHMQDFVNKIHINKIIDLETNKVF